MFFLTLLYSPEFWAEASLGQTSLEGEAFLYLKLAMPATTYSFSIMAAEENFQLFCCHEHLSQANN
ncbi:hypothetical protein LC607_23230 [Nostoc sp. CHAB 5824]|nr:hypothetical protein [Nostoc sp. CHAB 5824]